MTENVNHPAHYGGEDNPYEVIKVAEAWKFDEDAYLFNALKYIARPAKGNHLEDLKKAVWYLERKIGRLERESQLLENLDGPEAAWAGTMPIRLDVVDIGRFVTLVVTPGMTVNEALMRVRDACLPLCSDLTQRVLVTSHDGKWEILPGTSPVNTPYHTYFVKLDDIPASIPAAENCWDSDAQITVKSGFQVWTEYATGDETAGDFANRATSHMGIEEFEFPCGGSTLRHKGMDPIPVDGKLKDYASPGDILWLTEA